VVSSQARELAYICFKQLFYSQTLASQKNRKIKFVVQDLQIDNQLVRQNDAIILRKQFKNDLHFFTLKMHYTTSISWFGWKYFVMELVPFDLTLDGNFCDEFYKYTIDILLNSKKMKQLEQSNLNSGLVSMTDEIKRMKLAAFQQPKEQSLQTKIYFEQFYINEIKLNFTFYSSPILFREFSMNPTLKFFIVMLSNLKNTKLHLNSYKLQNQHLLVPTFLAQIKKHYI